jgi:hypothetical protein
MGELTRKQLLQELQRSQTQVVKLLEAMTPIQDWQPEPAEWSFRLIAAHLATVERTCHLPRIQRIASGETPMLTLYTNTAAGYQKADLHKSLKRWIAARRELVDFVNSLSTRQLEYTGIHESLGPMTVLEILREILAQDQGNLRHVRQLIEVYQEDNLSARQAARQPTGEAL